MKRNVFIFHGTEGSPQGNWLPWLKRKLKEKDCNVYVPKFPTPEGESLEAWLKVIEDYKQKINEKTILVGHSKGELFLLRLLERLKNPVHASFLVAAPIGVKPILFYKEDAKFSDGFELDWDKIKSNSSKFTVYHSDNDPYVCLDNGKELSKKLNIKLKFIPKAGHINEESGFTEFKDLLKDIELFL